MHKEYWHINSWFDAVSHCEHHAEAYALITVLTTAGSTPRDQGTKMVVTSERQFDTIGGGHLEFTAIELARQALVESVKTRANKQQIESFPLASKLGQCCGGAVKLLIETHVSHRQTLAIFGAGHVAQALVPILQQLPVSILWIDNRTAMQPVSSLPSNVSFICDDDPVGEVPLLPDGTWTIIMTHDHQLDFALVEKAMKRPEIPYIGMIGSETKVKRFSQRLLAKGVSPARLKDFYSPIGLSQVPGKRPIEVAVSVSAQIIQRLHQVTAEATIKQTITEEQHDASTAQ